MTLTVSILSLLILIFAGVATWHVSRENKELRARVDELEGRPILPPARCPRCGAEDPPELVVWARGTDFAQVGCSLCKFKPSGPAPAEPPAKEVDDAGGP